MFHRDVAKGVHRVEDSYTNWYLIEEDGKLTVVDCGLPGSWSSLLDALDRLDRSLSDIEAIVLTHGHFDHIGFAERARRELGIPVYVHENDVPLTKHPRSYSRLRSPAAYLIKPRALPIVASFVRMGALWPRAIAEVERFSDEGTLPVPGAPQIVFSPGHTIGHCAFYLPDRDTLIAGDAIVTLDPYTGETGPRLVARAATADLERAVRSLDALVATGAGTVLVGHGEPTYDVAATAEQARRNGAS